MKKLSRPKLWLGILALIMLSPLGLIIPAYFNASGAWGEWSKEELKNLQGFIPEGLERLSSLWNSLFPDYSFRQSTPDKGPLYDSLVYIVMALAGVSVVAAIIMAAGVVLTKKENEEKKE